MNTIKYGKENIVGAYIYRSYCLLKQLLFALFNNVIIDGHDVGI